MADSGLELIKKGVLFFIIAEVLLIIGAIMGLGLSIALLFSHPLVAGGSLLLFIFLLLIVLILKILGIINLWKGFSNLESQFNHSILGKIGSILILIPGIELIGYILLGVAFYLLGDKFNNGLMKLGGIITAIPFLNFIGLIIVFLSI
jgi:hypothetical protein